MRYSVAGFRYALKNEASIRQELLALAVLTPVSVALHVSRLEHLVLVVSMLLVLMVEFLNSAIEAAVDRVSLEEHPLAGQAKDLGSAAVFISLLIWGASWAAIDSRHWRLNPTRRLLGGSLLGAPYYLTSRFTLSE